jgi:hypothetical protein
VKAIVIIMGEGDDTLEFGSPEAVDFALAKYLAIDMGEGNDSVAFGKAGNTTGSTDPRAARLRTGTGIYLNMQGGDDTVEIAHLDVGGHLTLIAGDGDDQVLFATEFTPTGATEPTLFPARIKRNATISLGGGKDELDMKHAVVRGHLTINDFAGDATIDLYNLSVGQKVDIDTGDGADHVALDYVFGRHLTIDTNGGVDDVELDHCRFQTVNVKLGADRDDLTVRFTKVSRVTYLNGGENGSTFARGPANTLRGLIKRQLG